MTMHKQDTLLILDMHAVDTLLGMDEVSEAVTEAFVLHSRAQGRVFPVIREPLHMGGVFGIKAGDVASQDLLGYKAAGFWPGNRQQGGEPHQATVMLFDPATGRPYCLLDGNAITTLRTGAAGGLGLARLARQDSASLALFGAGVQAAIQLRFALRTLPHLKRVRYMTFDGKPDAAFERRFDGQVDLRHAVDGDAAVAESDVVITATPGAKVLFRAESVRPGTHVTAVGSDTKGKRELPEGLLPRARVYVDDAAQSRQIGELQWAPDTACVEIGAVLDGAQAGRSEDPAEITVFDMTGIALQDLTVARMLYRRASQEGVGVVIPWPWRSVG
ncbi:ornithine cyclodeaminase [Bordetella ansorpii]|uniref:Ornithine cyclodeaminase n=2 Tax=Bordetella ansorpii TaxID=288768 RepID=A0A157MQ86_9BORD|nr:ornithine cyclodeaminase family protein [Bordetella ansorpii]SAI11252.1 ornithine cyclodeaminase [Bordetella ansorpii]